MQNQEKRRSTIARMLLPLIVVLLLPAACSDFVPSFYVSSHRATALAAQPVNDPFQQALYRGYMALAGEQMTEGDYKAADIYYQKAIAAAQGQSVALEDLGPWTRSSGLRSRGLAGADLDAVRDMRPRLEAWINDTKVRDPAGAAAQQIKFDCWIEELSEQEAADAAACVPVITAVQAPPPVPAPQSFMVYFDNDQATLTTEADGIIRKAADAWKRGQSAHVTVIGHTDRAGNESYNQQLSERRAAAVKARLEQYGVSTGMIMTVAKGESDLQVPTREGVSEPRNRRVEIVIRQ